MKSNNRHSFIFFISLSKIELYFLHQYYYSLPNSTNKFKEQYKHSIYGSTKPPRPLSWTDMPLLHTQKSLELLPAFSVLKQVRVHRIWKTIWQFTFIYEQYNSSISNITLIYNKSYRWNIILVDFHSWISSSKLIQSN